MDTTSTTTLSTKRSAEEVHENAKRRKTDTKMADDTTEQEVTNNGESKELQRFKTLLKSYAHEMKRIYGERQSMYAEKWEDGDEEEEEYMHLCEGKKLGMIGLLLDVDSLDEKRLEDLKGRCGAAYDGFSPDELGRAAYDGFSPNELA